MILQKEIRDFATRWGVHPDIVDKDYVLGQFLAGFHKYYGARLVFKGGTCLRKCFYPGYRFSEDIDFTSQDGDFELTREALETVCKEVNNHCGLLFHAEEIASLVHQDQQKGYQAKIRYWGANHSRNEPPPPSDRWLTKIKLEISTDELLVNRTQFRTIYHPYSDELLNNAPVPCYSIDEILGEKLRSLVQRSYTAPRDIYDIYRLTNDFSNEDWQRLLLVFKEKMDHKRLTFSNIDDLIDESSLKRVRKAWGKSLSHQIPDEETIDVESLIGSVVERIKENLT